jgi:hypothetical protein
MKNTLVNILSVDPGQQCAGCGNGDVHDWRIAPRGQFLIHGDGRARRCRFPCADLCDHFDCAEARIYNERKKR